jgi:hypothetical protein
MGKTEGRPCVYAFCHVQKEVHERFPSSLCRVTPWQARLRSVALRASLNLRPDKTPRPARLPVKFASLQFSELFNGASKAQGVWQEKRG